MSCIGSEVGLCIFSCIEIANEPVNFPPKLVKISTIDLAKGLSFNAFLLSKLLSLVFSLDIYSLLPFKIFTAILSPIFLE